MANVPITFGSGGGSGSDDCTGAKAQARAGYTFIASDTDDEPAEGLIADYSGSTSFTPSTSAQTAATAGKYTPSNIVIAAIPSQHSDSGNVTLTAASTSKSYAAGWYDSAHGAQINAQSKSVTPSTSAQTVAPDSGYVLSSVSVAAIPNQTAGGAVTLTASNTSASRNAGAYLTSQFTVQISPQSKSFTPTAGGSTITPDSGRVLSSVSVSGDANLVASNIRSGASIFGISGNVHKFASASYSGLALSSYITLTGTLHTAVSTTQSCRYCTVTGHGFYPNGYQLYCWSTSLDTATIDMSYADGAHVLCCAAKGRSGTSDFFRWMPSENTSVFSWSNTSQIVPTWLGLSVNYLTLIGYY